MQDNHLANSFNFRWPGQPHEFENHPTPNFEYTLCDDLDTRQAESKWSSSVDRSLHSLNCLQLKQADKDLLFAEVQNILNDTCAFVSQLISCKYKENPENAITEMSRSFSYKCKNLNTHYKRNKLLEGKVC